ncbi:MAG: hypothetical protein K2N06_03605 [Oscillospiraceae bacterium]|nr:hypothetical protein [Oscillospiraceae bacterium]
MLNLMIVSGVSAVFAAILLVLRVISLTVARFALGMWNARILSHGSCRRCSAVWYVRFDWAMILSILSKLSAEIRAADGSGGKLLIRSVVGNEV